MNKETQAIIWSNAYIAWSLAFPMSSTHPGAYAETILSEALNKYNSLTQ